jgi:hypothetical protein
VLVAVFTGCTAMRGYPKRSGDLKAELKGLEQYYRPKLLDEYKALDEESARRVFRDEVVNGRIRAIDLQFNEFERSLAGEHVKVDVASDMALLALGATGTALPGFEVARTVLSAVSTFVTGTKASIDEKVYFKKTIPVLFAKMESLRKVVLVKIREGLTYDTEKYSLYEALIDLDDYYKAGTIPGALMGIIEESGATTRQADGELKEIATYTYLFDDNGRKIKRWLDDRSTEETGEEKNKKLRRLIRMHVKVTPTPSITDFIRSKEFMVERGDVVDKLEL